MNLPESIKKVTERIKQFLPIIFAVVMGLVAVGLLHHYLAKKEAALRQREVEVERLRQKIMGSYQEPLEVVIAAKDIPEGTELAASHLKTATIPQGFVQPYAARTSKQVLGTLTIAPLAEGEQILLNKIRRPGEVGPHAALSNFVPQGKRAVTIVVDAIAGVGGFVRPGDTVDILWTIQLPQEAGQQGQVVTLTLFQDVQILAVGRTIAGQPIRPEEQAPQQYPVTLALEPQEASFMLFAREHGKIQFSLRSPMDSSQVAVAPANIGTLMEKILGIPTHQEIKPPVKMTRKVEVYKGLKRDVVLLSEETGVSKGPE